MNPTLTIQVTLSWRWPSNPRANWGLRVCSL